MTSQRMRIDSYDDWLLHVFEERPNHDTTVLIDDVTIAGFLLRLFSAPAFLFGRYSKRQIADGISRICSINSSWLRDARSQAVPKDMQVQWVRAIATLYRDLFAVACENRLGLPPDDYPLENAVFLFWDMDCLEGAAMFPEEQHSAHLVDPIFDVLQEILEIDHLVCKESALHGLGTIQPWQEERVAAIIDRFLAIQSAVTDELKKYAALCREGDML